MTNIDFLPQRYREKTAIQKTKAWGLVVVALFGSTIAGASVYQHMLRQKVEEQLASVDPLHAAAQARMARLTQLQQKLDRVNASDRFYTYLRHPWPQTQLLAAVVGPLPETITLTELRIVREAPDRVTRPRGEQAANTQQQESAAPLLPADRDLKQLREEQGDRQTVIHISGVTREAADLHKYLAALGASPLIAKTQLHNIESLESAQQANASQFKAQAVVRPGYGQKGGPESPPNVLATAAKLAPREGSQ